MYSALTRVQTRADGILWGAMAAVALPWLGRLTPYARRLNVLTVVALLPLMWAANNPGDYFGLAGWLLNVDVALLVVTVSLAGTTLVGRILGGARSRPSVRYSLVLYVWHFPIFYYLSRNTLDWKWQARTLVGYAVTNAPSPSSRRWSSTSPAALARLGAVAGARRRPGRRYSVVWARTGPRRTRASRLRGADAPDESPRGAEAGDDRRRRDRSGHPAR